MHHSQRANTVSLPFKAVRGARVFAVACALSAALFAVGGGEALSEGADGSGDAADRGARIGAARDSIARWVELQRTLSKERADWRETKETLKELIEVKQREIKNLRERIAEAEQNITEEDERRAELVSENEALKALGETLRDAARGLESRLRALLARLPAPAVEPVEPLVQRMPEDPDKTEMSLSKRFQNVIGILNELDNFNTKVTVTSEVREVDGGRAEVTAMYVGVGQAYYVGADERIAGYGTAGEGGWAWKPAPGAGPRIADAIAIYENERVASFVLLPIEIE